jgi:hypothetical protein
MKLDRRHHDTPTTETRENTPDKRDQHRPPHTTNQQPPSIPDPQTRRFTHPIGNSGSTDLPGHLADVSLVRSLLADFASYGAGRMKLCLDRGFYSKTNIDAFMGTHR